MFNFSSKEKKKQNENIEKYLQALENLFNFAWH